MKVRLPSIEKCFSVLALLFYSELFSFQSLFTTSEGTEGIPLYISNPLQPLLQTMQHGIFLVALCLLAVRWERSLQVASKNIFFWCLLALIATSFLWSDFPDNTQRRSLAIIETTTFGLYFAARFNLREQLKLLAFAGGVFVLTSLCFSLAIPAQAIENGIHAGAWRGPLIQKNIFARVLVLFFTASYLDSPSSRLGRGFRIVTMFLTVVLVFLSTSKSALAILILLFIFVNSHRFLYSLFLRQSILLVPSLCLLVLTAAGALSLIAVNAGALVNSAGRSLTLSGRTVIWSAILTKISERPWLGYGYEGFWKGIYGESAYIGKVFGTTYIPPHSHNGFLELVLAFGFVGLSFFLLSFLVNAIYALRLPVLVRSYESYWPPIYLTFLIMYNQTESTLIAHNSIFWMLYVVLTFSRSTALNSSPEDNAVPPFQLSPQLSDGTERTAKKPL